MTLPNSSKARRRMSRRGSTMVESAFVYLPLFAIMLAIVDFSVAIFIRNTFQHAVREGVRYAVTYQTMSGLGHDASIKTVVQQNAMGFLNGTSGAEKIVIRYYSPDTLAFTTANSPGNIVEVSIEGYNWGWIAPIWRSGTPLAIVARSSDRMEGLPGGVSPPAR